MGWEPTVRQKIQWMESSVRHAKERKLNVNQICSNSNSFQVNYMNEFPYILQRCYISGVRNGFRKKLKGEGDMPPQQIASDIYLVAEQKPHPLYIRSGSDLILALELTLGKSDIVNIILTINQNFVIVTLSVHLYIFSWTSDRMHEVCETSCWKSKQNIQNSEIEHSSPEKENCYTWKGDAKNQFGCWR